MGEKAKAKLGAFDPDAPSITHTWPATKKAAKYIAVAVLSSSASIFLYARSQPATLPPGRQPFTPSRIDWLVTTLQASLRDEELDTNGYLLQITSPDPETILIYVRYLPTANREAMNISIDAARKVTEITINRYGWNNWVKIREDVKLADHSEKR